MANKRGLVADWALHLGDCRAEMPRLEGGSVDCVVTDPPYNLSANRDDRERGFMNCAWDDTVAFRPEVWAECLRIAKPGAYLLAFGGTRTHHRLMCAVEDAGWELTDTLCWLYGQGFPKGRGCLKPAWEPIVLARKPASRVAPLGIDECRIPIVGPVDPRRQAYRTPGNGMVGSGGVYEGGYNGGYEGAEVPHPDSPRHDARGRWPANLILSHHSECVCRGTRRVRGSHHAGTTRLGSAPDASPQGNNVYGPMAGHSPVDHVAPDGREEVEDWVCHPECPVFLLDSQAGHLHAPVSAGASNGDGVNCYADGWAERPGKRPSYTDSGPPSRFFYVAKATRRERWFYCADCGNAFESGERDRHGHGHVGGDGKPSWRHLKAHPTQKSLALMRWLVKLACPAGGLVLDPFAGSGSTGAACLRTGRRFLGVEKDPHYHQIALKRLAGVDGPLFAAAPAPEEDPA